VKSYLLDSCSIEDSSQELLAPVLIERNHQFPLASYLLLFFWKWLLDA